PRRQLAGRPGVFGRPEPRVVGRGGRWRASIRDAGDDPGPRARTFGGQRRGRSRTGPPRRLLSDAGGTGGSGANRTRTSCLAGPFGTGAQQPAGSAALDYRGQEGRARLASGWTALALLVAA